MFAAWSSAGAGASPTTCTIVRSRPTIRAMRCSSRASPATSSAVCRGRRGWGRAPDPWSPMRLQTCSQMWFDPILQRFARSFPHVTLRYRTRLESFEDTGAGVAAELVDLETGTRERVTADYLVGCDGATSAIRQSLGIELVGQGALGHPLHLFFKAPNLLERCGKAARLVLSAHRSRRAVGQRARHRSGERHVAPDGARQRRQADPADHRSRGAAAPCRRQGHRGRMDGRQRLDAAQPRRRALFARAGCSSPATPCISFRRPARSA